jgi:type VI protein secretion system component VasK
MKTIVSGAWLLVWVILMIVCFVYGRPLHIRFMHHNLQDQLTALESRYVLLNNRQDALIRLTDELRMDINNRRFDDISQHRRPFIEDMIPAIWDGCGCHGEGE